MRRKCQLGRKTMRDLTAQSLRTFVPVMVKTISLQWVSVKLVSHAVFPTPRIGMFSNSQMFWYSGYKVDLEKLPGKWKIG